MSDTNLSRLKRSQRDYTMAFKLSVVSAVEQGHLTYKQAQTKYGIQGRSTVLVWLRKHGKLDWSARRDRSMTKIPETPEQTIKRLERELQEAKDKVYLLDEMVTLIDQQYGMNLRKKSLSKQRSKPKHKGG